MNIEQSLIKWGLTDRESRVYNSLIKKVESTVYELALDTKIPRTTVYETLENLSNKGLISYSRKNGIKYFFAETPNRLMKILEEKMAMTKELLPILLAMPPESTSPTVKVYIGAEGKKKVLDDILETLKRTNQMEFYVIPGIELYNDLPEYMRKWIKEKETMNLHSLVITGDNPEHVAPKMYQNSKLRETRLIPFDYISLTGTNIYQGKVALYSKVGEVEHSMIIESPSIYDAFKKFFMFMWINATKSINTEEQK
jgi:sugar-specific transcriptional regulator TrmB